MVNKCCGGFLSNVGGFKRLGSDRVFFPKNVLTPDNGSSAIPLVTTVKAEMVRSMIKITERR